MHIPMVDRSVPKHIIDPVCKSVGFLVLSWTFVEAALNSWIAIVYQSAGGKHLEAEIPKALSRKVRFIRLCFNRLAVLGPFKTEGLAFVDRLSAIADTRHFVVHGTLSHYDESADHLLTFMRIDVHSSKTVHVLNEMQITGRDLLAKGEECAALAGPMVDFADRLMKALVPKDNPQEFFRGG